MINIQINTAQVRQAAARASGFGAQILSIAARAVANLVKNHLFERDTRGNALGGKRTHFYSTAAKSVETATADGAASITITKIGLAQRWLGGTIRAGAGISSATGGPTKYLAIPARAEAYGRTPAEFSDLKFVPRRNGGAMLVQAHQTLVAGFTKKGAQRKLGARGTTPGSAGEAGGLVMFWLVTEVTQQPDPTVMPTEEAMHAAAATSIESYLARRLQ
jgi:hypothetical protein